VKARPAGGAAPKDVTCLDPCHEAEHSACPCVLHRIVAQRGWYESAHEAPNKLCLLENEQ
jgi:hypothetical protein